MGAAGILHEDERVELIDGEIVRMAAVGSRHMGTVIRLDRQFHARVGNHAIVSVQNPLRLPPRAEPEPDVALLRPRDDDYTTGLPGPEDVLLIVEVADTSLDYDRDVKLPLYAAAGILVAWLVDLPGRRIAVYRDPSPAGYRTRDEFSDGSLPVPEGLPELTIRVHAILG